MHHAEKTVFISYRRDTSLYIARSIFQDLQHNGYDVFLDVESIDSGTFETIILNQIAARAHSVVVLEPGSVQRFVERGDWLRREVERAIEQKRNIVPILASKFSFAEYKRYFTGKLKALPGYNGVHVPRGYFEEATERLRSRFLNKPISVTIVPTPASDREVVKKKSDEASQLPNTTVEQIDAEFLFYSGNEKYAKGDFTGAIEDFSEAIALNPKGAGADNWSAKVVDDTGTIRAS